MEKKKIARIAIRHAVSFATSTVISRAIATNVPTKSTLDEVVVTTGTFVTSYVAADAVTRRAEVLFDELVHELKSHSN